MGLISSRFSETHSKDMGAVLSDLQRLWFNFKLGSIFQLGSSGFTIKSDRQMQIREHYTFDQTGLT